MAKIDKRIVEKLQKKLGVTLRRVYQLIDQKSTTLFIPRYKAAYILAAEKGINVTRFLSETELGELRQVKSHKDYEQFSSASKISSLRLKRENRLTIDGIEYSDPFLDESVSKNAIENSKLYPVVYLFENSVRNVIKRILSSKHGSDWWNKCISHNVKQNVEIRIKKDKESPWHSARGAHPIFYNNIGDLRSIFTVNNAHFRPILGKLETIYVWIEEIEKTRNTLAHNNPVKKRDRERLLGFARDWLELVKAKKNLIP